MICPISKIINKDLPPFRLEWMVWYVLGRGSMKSSSSLMLIMLELKILPESMCRSVSWCLTFVTPTSLCSWGCVSFPTANLLPVLLMERFDGSLDELLEPVPNIPLALKQSILEDVSRGLRVYLQHKHTPQIIHRDVTAKNVLLTSSLVAKITDFGNSHIVNLQPGQLARTHSRLPGTLVYIPPEALEASSRYGPSLDIFSFGHLALFIRLQVGRHSICWPWFLDSLFPVHIRIQRVCGQTVTTD